MVLRHMSKTPTHMKWIKLKNNNWKLRKLINLLRHRNSNRCTSQHMKTMCSYPKNLRYSWPGGTQSRPLTFCRASCHTLWSPRYHFLLQSNPLREESHRFKRKRLIWKRIANMSNYSSSRWILILWSDQHGHPSRNGASEREEERRMERWENGPSLPSPHPSAPRPRWTRGCQPWAKLDKTQLWLVWADYSNMRFRTH